MNKYVTDLTKGNVSVLLIKFATPFFVAQILQSTYSMVDMLIVGHFMGDRGISAINTSSIVVLFITMLINGFSLSGTVLVAQYVGKKDLEEANKTIGTLFTMFFIIGVFVGLIGQIFTPFILEMLNTPSETIKEASNYLRICFGGTLFICGYNAISGILRGLGDSKRPLIFVLIATIINIVLDLIFVGAFGWGAAGAAVATIGAQGVSFILAIYTLYKNNFVFDFKLKSFAICKDKLNKILKIGLPSAVQSTVVNFSMLFILTSINAYGLDASAAAGIGNKIDSYAVLSAVALNYSVASMVGQNLGAGEIDRVKKTVVSGIGISVFFSIIILLVVNVFVYEIVGLFNSTKETAELAVLYTRYVSVSYIANAIVFVMNGLAVGSGYSTFSLLNAFTSVVIFRVILVYVFETGYNMGLEGIFLAMGLGQFGGLIPSLYFYLSNKWKNSFVSQTNII